QRIGGNVDVGDLTRGVHTGVGTTRRTQPYRYAAHCRKRVIDNARDRALSGLHSPAGELCSVVSDIEPKTNKPATGIDGGFVRHALTTCRHPRRSQPSPRLPQPLAPRPPPPLPPPEPPRSRRLRPCPLRPSLGPLSPRPRPRRKPLSPRPRPRRKPLSPRPRPRRKPWPSREAVVPRP